MQEMKCHLFVVSIMLGLMQSEADLGAAIRRSSVHAWVDASENNAILPAKAPLAGPLVLQLERVGVRGAGAGTAYVGKCAVGQPPQELSILFDTGSGHVLLPHRACKSLSCQEHNRYSPWQSITAMDVNADGSPVQEGRRMAKGNVTRSAVEISFTQADLGEGTAKAVVVRDQLCMEGDAGPACVDMALLPAIHMDDTPFRAMPSDGIVGLGLETLAAHPMFSFMGRLAEGSKNVLPQFGISFNTAGGQIYFGGQNPHLASAIQWFPVDHPEAGYWQVAIQAVRVGNLTVDSCHGGCHGVVDTGAAILGVQASKIQRLRNALKSTSMPHGKCSGPTLEFDLGGMVLTLDAPDYTGTACQPELGSLNLQEPEFMGVYAFGGTVLRRYYAAFDWSSQRVGFAPASRDELVLV